MIQAVFLIPLLAAAATASKAAGAAAAAATAAPLAPALQNFQFAQIHKSPLAANAPWLTHTFAGIFLIAAIALVVLLAVQTTKQEGLGGTIGGRVESAYRPRLGFDEQLQRLTSFVAIVFVVFGTIVALSGI
ncbi:MAG: preprotein translocase subunit SecG [Vulcanimicrobiaceae bacterium]